MEFMREFPDDAACLEWLCRERFSEDGTHADCPEVQAAPDVQALRDLAAPPVVDVHRVRTPRPPDGRDDLPQVLHVPAPLVLRLLPDD